ncbi:type II secretion system protein GspM [Porticoccaceae bacterium]|nr:type II secretion system protein GspM [Porticoccaceae bacterium]
MISALMANRLLSKALAVSLLIVLLASISNLIIGSLIQRFGEQLQRNQHLEETAGRYINFISNEEHYLKIRERIDAYPLRDILYTAPSDTSLGAVLQADVRQLILQAGGRIDSMQSIQTTEKDELRKIGVSISMRTDIETLTEIVKKIKAAAKLMKIDNAVIRAPEIQPEIGQPALTLRCDIFAYGRIEAGN